MMYMRRSTHVFKPVMLCLPNSFFSQQGNEFDIDRHNLSDYLKPGEPHSATVRTSGTLYTDVIEFGGKYLFKALPKLRRNSSNIQGFLTMRAKDRHEALIDKAIQHVIFVEVFKFDT